MPPETIFRALTDRLGLEAAHGAELWRELETRYREPHRHYHRLTHIAAMLGGAAALNRNDAGLLLAIFYHDIVYDPARSDNEAQSAVLFKDRFHGYIDNAMSVQVFAMIEATKSHRPTGDDLTDLLLDLDMAILGTPWPEYLAYAEGVAQEYIPVYGSDAYRAGRVAMFLTPVLAQPRIFLTAAFAGLEDAARDNLKREIDRLSSDGSH